MATIQESERAGPIVGDTEHVDAAHPDGNPSNVVRAADADSQEAEVGAAPNLVDTDGDGLAYGQEADVRSDPLSAGTTTRPGTTTQPDTTTDPVALAGRAGNVPTAATMPTLNGTAEVAATRGPSLEAANVARRRRTLRHPGSAHGADPYDFDTDADELGDGDEVECVGTDINPIEAGPGDQLRPVSVRTRKRRE